MLMQVATGPAAVLRRCVQRGRTVRFALAALLAAGAVLVPAGVAVAKPTFTPEAKTAAIVRPAVVYIEVQWEGWVRDKTSGKLWDNNSVSFVARCSGFAVSNDGFIVTARHCVDPGVEGVATSFFQAIADRYVKAGLIDKSQIQASVSNMIANAEVEGQSAGQPPVRKVFAQRGVAKPGLASGEAMPARVVSFHPGSEGDVALIKVEKSNQPMVTLADSSDIQVGSNVLAIGYPAAADNITNATDATLEPSNKDGKISSKRTEGGVPFYETSAATTQGMSGGPVANLNGDVIGLISHGPAAQKQAFNFLAGSSVIAEELSKAGVKNELGKIDKDYRDGLNDYYEGRYTSAIEKFDQVLAAVPSHAQAQDYRQQAVSRRTSEGDPSNAGLGLLIIFGAGGFVLVIVIVVIILLVRRNRRSKQAAAGYPMAPVPYPPISGPPYGEPPVAASQPLSSPPNSSPPVSSSPTSSSPTSSSPLAASPISSPPAAATQPPQAVNQMSAPPAPLLVYCSNCGTGSPAGTKLCAICGKQFS
jgi:serine protease Do